MNVRVHDIFMESDKNFTQRDILKLIKLMRMELKELAIILSQAHSVNVNIIFLGKIEMNVLEGFMEKSDFPAVLIQVLLKSEGLMVFEMMECKEMENDIAKNLGLIQCAFEGKILTIRLLKKKKKKYKS